MERKERLPLLMDLLQELDSIEQDEKLEEKAAELEDAIFLYATADGPEEEANALEEISLQAEDLAELSAENPELTGIASRLGELASK